MRPLFLHIPFSEKILFARHLSLMTKTGMPLLDSLRLLQKQMRSGTFRTILAKATEDVENGKFLSDSLAQYRRIFGDLFINVIRIGEASGLLSDNLQYLATELKKQFSLRQKIRAALVYPLIVPTATLGITGILVFFVLPRILPIFKSLKVELPLSTRIMIAVSTVLLNYGGWIILGLAVLAVIWTLLLRLRPVRLFAHRVLLYLPFISSVVRLANISDITRTLGLLLKSGIQIVEALRITAISTPNLVYQEALTEIEAAVGRGESLHEYLGRHGHLFPPTVTYMIETGETTGNLESNLFYLADFYESEVDELTKNLSSILEPALLLVMGGIVGFVAIAIISPIYSVTQSLRP